MTPRRVAAYVYGVLALLASLALAFGGVVFLFSEPLLGALLVVAALAALGAGLLAVPAVRRTLDDRFDVSLSARATGGAVGGLSVASALAVIVTLALIVGAAAAEPAFRQTDGAAWAGVDTNADDTRAEGTATLENDTYALYRFSAGTPVSLQVSLEVSSGGAIDVLVMEEDQLDRFREGKVVRYRTSLSDPETTGYEATETVAAGDYVVLVDNTDYAKVEADGPVTVELTFRLR